MNIDQIIGKLMGDESIGEEKSALDAWKKEAEENMRALEDIKKIASLSDTLNGYQDFNSDEAWSSFSNSLDGGHTVREEKQNKAKLFSISNLTKIAAILVVVLGSVFVFNQFSDSEVVADDKVYTALDTNLDFNLNDGSEITLDKKSELKVIGERSVTLIGRAHFDIARDESVQFKIELPVGDVVVLGTEFTIDSDENRTEIFVEEGSVQYSLGEQTYVLVEGDLVKVVNNEVVVLKGNDENYNSWKNQRLMFRDDNMVVVVDALSRHFKKEIIIEDKKAFAKCNVVNVFINATLNDILNDLSESHQLKYVLKDGKIYITSANC